MTANEVMRFRHHLEQQDPENWESRRAFHEKFEWLEGYWRSNSTLGTIEKFSDHYGAFYWAIPELETFAKELAAEGFVGNSKDQHYSLTPEIKKATNNLVNNTGTPAEKYRDMMLIVRQIRNNLFHGKKMELGDQNQYERNKKLVRFARDITDLILERLEEAENVCL